MAKTVIAITPTALRQWADNPPKGTQYVPVHAITLRRLAAAIEALERIAEPLKWEQEHLEPDHDLDYPVLLNMLEKAGYYRSVGEGALKALKGAP